MSTEDHGKDLEAVQALQRKQEDVERDMTAIHLQLGVRNHIHPNSPCYYSICTSLCPRSSSIVGKLVNAECELSECTFIFNLDVSE